MYSLQLFKILIDVNLILWGDKFLSDDGNVKMFKAVHTFIHECGRLIQYKKLYF